MFRTISRNNQGRTAHHIFNRLIRQLGSAEEPFYEYENNYEKLVHSRCYNVRHRGYTKPVQDCDEVVIRDNVQKFYTHLHQLQTMNNLLSVL